MSDPSSPPPAYELTDQEFDAKTNEVLQTSAESEQDEWEIWDDARHEAAAQRLQEDLGMASSSTAAYLSQYPAFPVHLLNAFQPLNIKKQRKKEKELPSWLTDPSSSSAQLQAQSERLSMPNRSAEQISRSGGALSSDGEDGHTIAPPPFTSVASQMPPVLTHDGNTSNPPSPLTSPVLRRTPLPTRPPLPPLPPALERGNLPDGLTPSHHRHTLPPRVVEGRSDSSLPRMQFDPSVAYRGRRSDTTAILQMEAPPYESFYNSAVTPFFSKKPPEPTTPPAPAIQSGLSRSTSQYYYPSQQPTFISPNPGNPSWANPQFNQSRPTSIPTVYASQLGTNRLSLASYPSYSVSQPVQPSNAMQASGVGGQVQGPYAASEQHMMWDVYSPRR